MAPGQFSQEAQWVTGGIHGIALSAGLPVSDDGIAEHRNEASQMEETVGAQAASGRTSIGDDRHGGIGSSSRLIGCPSAILASASLR